ncbi:hypothetical protein [Flavobacterium cellulosilyticum]|uniref:Uncharacterized protein n=1 Tax=Flavobacterium cellulosilyticum TaxID=2541731 RepID=A0A4R5C7L0_9FLAO|nr:hypothetical protein [Flavobacterium cellulosilyticum]TDD94113.1 hypothetical protein E0F76_17635 [Flavobacterium cellulosilyticum]
MKKQFTYIYLILIQICFSQNNANSIDLKGVQILNSTALSLLDNTAAIITSNPDCKDFNINTENLSNISLDFSLNKGKLNGLEYYGLGKNTNDFKQATINKLLRPNISGVINQTDSLTKIAAGFNVNIVTVFRSNKVEMIEAYSYFRSITQKIVDNADSRMERDFPNITRTSNTEEYYKKRDEIVASLEYEKADDFAEILKKPLLMLDLAVAYSTLYSNNTYKNNQQDRLGVWSTLTFSPKVDTNYLNLYGFVRYIKDNAVYNNLTSGYTDQLEYFDYGCKIQLDVDALSFGYEYIKRNGNGKDYRSVGVIQYKINSNYHLTGGFGKNFTSDSSKDLVSLIGIRWGMNKKDSKEWDK